MNSSSYNKEFCWPLSMDVSCNFFWALCGQNSDGVGFQGWHRIVTFNGSSWAMRGCAIQRTSFSKESTHPVDLEVLDGLYKPSIRVRRTQMCDSFMLEWNSCIAWSFDSACLGWNRKSLAPRLSVSDHFFAFRIKWNDDWCNQARQSMCKMSLDFHRFEKSEWRSTNLYPHMAVVSHGKVWWWLRRGSPGFQVQHLRTGNPISCSNMAGIFAHIWR